VWRHALQGAASGFWLMMLVAGSAVHESFDIATSYEVRACPLMWVDGLYMRRRSRAVPGRARPRKSLSFLGRRPNGAEFAGNAEGCVSLPKGYGGLMKSKILGLLAVGLLAGPMAANAERVTVYFYAEVTQVIDDVLNLFPLAGIVPGKKFTGSFEYDTTETNQDNSASADFFRYSNFALNGIPGTFIPSSIAASAESPADYWQMIAGWDFPATATGGTAEGGSIGLFAISGVGIQNTDSTAPKFVGAGSGHPILIPEPLSLINVGSMAYITFAPNFVIALAGFSVQMSLDPPADIAIGDLVDEVLALDVGEGVSSSLNSKLDAALKAIEDGNEENDVAAINSLRAFINSVEAQRGRSLEEDVACDLIEAADSIIVLLGGVSSASTCLVPG
jgi:hypothetical protein